MTAGACNSWISNAKGGKKDCEEAWRIRKGECPFFFFLAPTVAGVCEVFRSTGKPPLRKKSFVNCWFLQKIAICLLAYLLVSVDVSECKKKEQQVLARDLWPTGQKRASNTQPKSVRKSATPLLPELANTNHHRAPKYLGILEEEVYLQVSVRLRTQHLPSI